MRKPVNVRPPIIIALSLIAGIASGVIFSYYGVNIAWSVMILLLPLLAAALFFITKFKLKKPLVICAFVALFFILGSLNAFYSIARFDAGFEITADKTYTVSGTVIEKGKLNNGKYIIIDSLSFDGNETDGKAYVYLSDTYGDYCEMGYTVYFESKIEKNLPFKYAKLTNNAEENIKYFASAYSDLRASYGYSFFGGIRSAIYNTLFDNLSYETAAVSYAMLTGNSQNIGQNVIEGFRYGGVAHIFAVSGLHIGLIFALIDFICKKLRVNKYLASFLGIALITFYSGICGFTLSSLRALIMCSVASLAKLLNAKNDGLNALSVAVLIILCINPLSLFSVGFQLSVCAVGAIFALSKNISGILKKIKIPSKISDAAGISFSAQLGTLPIMLSSFGYVSGAGLLLNIIIVPLMSASFSLLFLSVFFSIIIAPISAFVIPYAVLPLELLLSFLTNSGLENVLISGFGAGAFSLIYFPALIFVTDKLNIKNITRLIALSCSAVILTSYVLLKTYYPFGGYRLIVSGYNDSGQIILKCPQGNILIVTDDSSSSDVTSIIHEHYINNIYAVIILGENAAEAYGALDITCENVYVCLLNFPYQPYSGIELHYVKSFEIFGVDFDFADLNSLTADVNGICFGIASGEDTAIESCNVFITENMSCFCECGYSICLCERGGDYNIIDNGDIVLDIINEECYIASPLIQRRL